MTQTSSEPTAAPRAKLPSFLGRFTVLRGSARELWIVFGVKLLGIAAYSIMNTTFVLWLSYNLGYSDANAGLIVAAWSTVMTLITVFVGSLTDAIGLRKAILLGLCVCIFSRGVLAFTTVKWLALAAGMLPLALGEALGVPVLVAGIRRYSTTAQRSISFAIFYAMMNVGFLIAGFILDYVRKGLGEPHGHYTLPVVGMEFSTYRVLFLISFLFELALLPIVYFFLREGVEATDEGLKITPETPKYPGANLWNSLQRTTCDALRDTIRIFVGLWRQSGFYKFLVFLSLAAFVRLIFIHMYYTYPKFGIRELGEGAPIGRLMAINSLLIIVLVPIVGALTQRISAYRMVSFGSAIAALSVFIMAVPPKVFQPLADGRLGHLIADAANTWFGGQYRFSPDDFRDPSALARQFASASNSVVLSLNESLTETTRSLLQRQLAAEPGGLVSAPYPSTAMIQAEDLRNVPAFIERLQRDNIATRPVSQFLWQEFSAANQKTLSDPATPVAVSQAVLAQELNRVLHAESLYNQQRFAGVALSEATRHLFREDPKQKTGALPNQSLLFNRLLLEDTYPKELARSAHPLRVALAQDFSQIIKDPSLRRKPGFAKIALSPETSERLAQDPQEGNSLLRVNRLLIEDAFPSEIAKNRVGVAGSVSPYYVMIFFFIVVLSFGESFYSPRLYEYAAVIAPKGQEASYMSLSYLPFFMAKLLVATFSGLLLAGFCPETGPRHSSSLWLIIALTTLIAPVGLITLRRFIQVREAGREE